jgi:sn-glycerol 3-phosphate transport system ATP-binding protein
MAGVSIRNVFKSFGAVKVIQGISMDIKDGEFVVMVGPSGCGKSTLLRMVAGLESISAGEIAIGERVVNDLEPKDRDIAMVFQNYALYPHMSVRENMAYGLKIRRMARADIDARVKRAAEILELGPFLDRKPRALSGGQRQRVAMGRAIVREPAVFLFDEPLSNLDAKLRVQMRVELQALHRRLGTTSLYVTHDQVEAMTLAHRMIVMNSGRAEQIGAPLDVYAKPATTFVAGFIGSPRTSCRAINARSIALDGGGAARVGDGRPPGRSASVEHPGAVPPNLAGRRNGRTLGADSVAHRPPDHALMRVARLTSPRHDAALAPTRAVHLFDAQPAPEVHDRNPLSRMAVSAPRTAVPARSLPRTR